MRFTERFTANNNTNEGLLSPALYLVAEGGEISVRGNDNYWLVTVNVSQEGGPCLAYCWVTTSCDKAIRLARCVEKLLGALKQGYEGPRIIPEDLRRLSMTNRFVPSWVIDAMVAD